MKQNKETVKSYFETGDKPTQEQYHDTWDSFWHKDESIPAETVSDLNKQIEITDASSDVTLTDADFNATFIVNTTTAKTVTIPTSVLRDGFICYFLVVGTGQVSLVGETGTTLNAPTGTLLSQDKRGLVEKQLSNDIFHVLGDWE